MTLRRECRNRSRMSTDTTSKIGGSAPSPSPAVGATETRLARLEALLAERHGSLPVWVRSPKSGPEHYTGFSRAKLYEGAGKGHFRSVSIREPGQIKGTRLFHLASILDFIERSEAGAMEGAK